MDKGTKIYAGVLAVIVVILAVVFMYEPPKVAELNERLGSDAEISNFTYRFKVLSVENGVATLSTPRSTEVPVEQVLGLLFPEAMGRKPDSQEFQAAQKSLAKVQTKARDLVLADAEIKRVAWQLDYDWLNQHGVQIIAR